MLSKTKKWIYWVTGTLLGIFILLATALALTPTFIKYYFNSWLEQQGLQGAVEEVVLQFASGKIAVKKVSIGHKDKKVLELGELAVQIRPKDILDNKITIESLKVSGLKLLTSQEADSFSFAGISLGNDETDKTAADKHSATQWAISIQGIELNDIHYCFEQSTSKQKTVLNLCQSIGSLQWKGHAEYSTALPIDKAVRAKGKLAISNTTIIDRKKDRVLMTLGNLNIGKMKIPSVDDINIQNIALKDFKILRKNNETQEGLHTVQSEEVLVSKLTVLKKNNLIIENIILSGLAGTLKITENGKPAALEYIQTLLPESKNTQEQKDKTSFTIKLQQVSIETDDTIAILDNSVQPPVLHKLGKLHLSVKNINSADKNNFSPLDIQLKVGEYGVVKMSGKAQFFAAKPSYFIDANIKALDLAELSSYSNKLLHYKIKSGQLDAELKLSIEQGQLNSNATLYLHKFYVEKSDKKTETRDQEKLGMPLSAALSLLRSKEDRIKLELPITGDIKNPDFSLNDAFNTVTVKAIKSTIVNYYISFGLIPVLEKSFDLATALRFNPVIFDAESIELDSEDKQQLEKISQLLHERPEVHLIICGHVTRDDRFRLFPMQQEWFQENKPETPPDDEDGTKKESSSPPLPSLSEKQLEKLISLAKQRGEKVKEYLVKTQGIGGNRLILCNPVYDPEDTDPPYVEIKI